MKWIALVILVCLGAYTWLTLHYRKQNPSFRPYEDMKNRANTVRLLSAGFQRVSVAVELPADPVRPAGGAVITAGPGGLPEVLRTTLVELPLLPAGYRRVSAAPTGNPLLPYPVHFHCVAPDLHVQLAGARLYLRESELLIVPELERLRGDLLARNLETPVRITVPAGTLRPGPCRVTLVGANGSQSWDLHVH